MRNVTTATGAIVAAAASTIARWIEECTTEQAQAPEQPQ